MAENKQQQEIKEITEKLEQGVKELFESEKYKVFLHTMSKFHNYSLNNTMLISMQKPDATLVAGYTAWQHDHERHVLKGEKGIRIFAPAPYKIKVEQEKLDPVTNKPVLDGNNNPVKEVVEVKKPAFKLVSVFDVSQTEGKEIADLGVEELLGDVEDYVHFFDALERSSPVPIGFEKIEGGAKGYYHQVECRIALNEGMSEVQNVKTLIHEMAHQKLHAVENVDKDLKLSRSAKEVEAESIAYVICQHYGIDTSEYSFAYLAGWSEGKDTPELKASLDRIRKSSNEMINEIDSHIAEINLELLSEKNNHVTCYLKISGSMGSEYAVDRITGTPEQIEAALKEVKEAGKSDTPIDNIEEFLESRDISVLALGSSIDDEPVRLLHPEYEYDVDTNEIYREGAAIGHDISQEEKALRLAIRMDALAYEFDLYEYRDNVEDREELVLRLQQDLLGDKEAVSGMVQWFQELVDEETNEAEDAQKIIDEIHSFMNEQPQGSISFYVAECMEFPDYGELHEGLTIKEAFDIYEKIPSDRLHGVKGIGFELEDGSIYAGKFDLMCGGVIQDETINCITHYRNSPLVQGAIQQCREERDVRMGDISDGIEVGAYVVGEDKYLSMQVAMDGSWDYSLYDKDYKLIDGGQIGDDKMSFADARNEILQSFDLMQENIRSMNPDVLDERVNVQESIVIPEYQKQFVMEMMNLGLNVDGTIVGGKNVSFTDHVMTEDEIKNIKRQVEYESIPKMLYTSDQWKEIESGMKHQLDVKAFSDPEYTASQMKEIRIGLDKGVDISAFASLDYSDKQMREIRRGIEAGLDVSSYAHPEISAGDMRKAFFALKDGTNPLENQSNGMEPDKDSGMYRYYSTQRPVAPGTFPGKPTHIHNFDSRENVCGGQMQAWGYVEYEKPLSEKQMNDYELKPAVRKAVAKEQPSFLVSEKPVKKEDVKKKSVMENLRMKQTQIALADTKKTKSYEKGARE